MLTSIKKSQNIIIHICQKVISPAFIKKINPTNIKREVRFVCNNK